MWNSFKVSSGCQRTLASIPCEYKLCDNNTWLVMICDNKKIWWEIYLAIAACLKGWYELLRRLIGSQRTQHARCSLKKIQYLKPSFSLLRWDLLTQKKKTFYFLFASAWLNKAQVAWPRSRTEEGNCTENIVFDVRFAQEQGNVT